jgi:hypothetical protein
MGQILTHLLSSSVSNIKISCAFSSNQSSQGSFSLFYDEDTRISNMYLTHYFDNATTSYRLFVSIFQYSILISQSRMFIVV